MLSVLYLFTLTVAGLAIVQRVMPSAPAMVRLCCGFLGVVASAWITYAVAFGLSPATDNSLLIGILATLAVHGAVIGVWGGTCARPVQAVVARGAVHRRLVGVFVLADVIAHNLSDSPLHIRILGGDQTGELVASPALPDDWPLRPSGEDRDLQHAQRLPHAGAPYRRDRRSALRCFRAAAVAAPGHRT